MTTKYESAAVVSGRVRVVDPGLSPGTCLSATVQVLRVEADGRTTLLGSKATEPDGSYRVVLGQPLAGGDVYFALLASSVDRELAFCAGAQSGSRLAPVVKTVT